MRRQPHGGSQPGGGSQLGLVVQRAAMEQPAQESLDMLVRHAVRRPQTRQLPHPLAPPSRTPPRQAGGAPNRRNHRPPLPPPPPRPPSSAPTPASSEAHPSEPQALMRP